MKSLIKQFGFRFAATFFLAVFPLAVNASDTFSASLLEEDLYMVQGPSGNTLIAVDSDGLILIEGVPAELANEYLAFAKKVTGKKKIKTLVNTHWHPESAGLNKAVRRSGGDVVAHANTNQWLRASIRKRGELTDHKPVPKKYLPNTTFYDTYSIPFQSGSIELGYLLQAHTDGDIYVYFPQQNVFYSGPVLRSDSWSVVDESTNGFIGGLMDAYDVIDGIVTAGTKIVPASGAQMSKADFVAQSEMYKGLTKSMVALLREGKSPEEVIAENPAAGLKPEWGDPSEFLNQGFRSLFGHLRNSRHVGVMP